MVTYTTAAIVRRRIEDIDTDLSDSDIENFITDAEGIIDCTMQYSFISTFDSSKHKLIRNIATDIAAFYCISWQTGDFLSVSRVSLVADMLWASVERGLKMLSDQGILEYLKSL